MRRIILLGLAIFVGLVGNLGHYDSLSAQGQELLQNPSFEGYFISAPGGWSLNATAGVSSTGHTWPGESRTGQSWDISATSSMFTMYGIQHVSGIASGSRVRFLAWANVFTCNKGTSCIEGNSGHRVSDQTSQARTRVGIDPTGGTDPGAASVVWSSFIAPFDQFQVMSVDATVRGSNGATVFVNAIQSVAMLLNHVYWDDASLTVISGSSGGSSSSSGSTSSSSGSIGSSGDSNSGSSATSAPRPTLAPIQVQKPRPDGSIVHIVQAGDTLSRIAIAYNVTMQQIVDLNNLGSTSAILRIGQQLTIRAVPGSTAIAAKVTAPVSAQGAVATTASPWSTSGGTSLCVTVYLDSNRNQQQDAGEPLVAGVPINISPVTASASGTGTAGPDIAAARTQASAADVPTCFTNLAAGNYLVTASPASPYSLTTADQINAAVPASGQLAVYFGVVSSIQSPQLTGDRRGPLSSLGIGLLLAIGGAGTIALGGLGMLSWFRRRV